MGKTSKKVLARKLRHKRLRQKIKGTSECPRLNVFRSLRYLYAQLIDDRAGHTLVAASTRELLNDNVITQGGNIEAATALGKLLAEKAAAKGIKEVVFDRGGYLYHGGIKALADAAREAGLEF